MSKLEALSYFQRALESSRGLVLREKNNQGDQLLSALNRYRAAFVSEGLALLQDISIVPSPTVPDSDIWLVKKGKPNA